MNRLKKYLSSILGYTRRERRATMVLAIILLVLIIFRYNFIKEDTEKFSVMPLPESKAPVENHSDSTLKISPFFFDPNNVTREELLSLGFTVRQASTLIKYRNAGAKFFSASDLYKVYGIDSQLITILSPYIKIEIPEEKIHHQNKDFSTATGGFKKSNPFQPLDLNKCSSVDLQALPGIGSVLSERIIKYRKLLGGFISPLQLKEVYGIDSLCVLKIQGMVFAGSDSVRRIRLDSCSYKDLAKHPYIGPVTARAIIKYRDLLGAPANIEDLVKQKVIDSITGNRIRNYCTFAR